MATKIRLQRHGKKGKPFFHIVVSDSRARRDGKYIERLGFYNPTTVPASVDLDIDRSLYWVQQGAEPTDTAHAILKYKGVLHKNHLYKGVSKGAFSAEEAEKKFEEWQATHHANIDHKRTKHKEERAAQVSAIIASGVEAAAARKKAKADAAAKLEAAENAEEVVEEGVEVIENEETAEENVQELATEQVAEETATEEAPAEDIVAEETATEEVVAETEAAEEAAPEADATETVDDEAAEESEEGTEEKKEEA